MGHFRNAISRKLFAFQKICIRSFLRNLNVIFRNHSFQSYICTLLVHRATFATVTFAHWKIKGKFEFTLVKVEKSFSNDIVYLQGRFSVTYFYFLSWKAKLNFKYEINLVHKNEKFSVCNCTHIHSLKARIVKFSQEVQNRKFQRKTPY